MKFIYIFTLLLAPLAQAELDQSSQEALQLTKEVMKNKEYRQEAIEKDKQYKAVDAELDKLTDNEAHKEKMYDLSAEILQKIVEKAKGDPEVMKKILKEAQDNPEQFMRDYVSTHHQKKVRNLANEIEKEKKILPRQQAPY